jgi:vacuolar-type H+-ATPase subunit H
LEIETHLKVNCKYNSKPTQRRPPLPERKQKGGEANQHRTSENTHTHTRKKENTRKNRKKKPTKTSKQKEHHVESGKKNAKEIRSRKTSNRATAALERGTS